MRKERFSLVGVAAIVAVLASSGCKRSPAPNADSNPAASANNNNVSAKPTSSVAVAGSAAPSASVVPGSHEDWCEEHQVPESKCTKCDPSLIPAFKAAGDWCNEHNMPESQCTKCDPKRKPVRPPKS